MVELSTQRAKPELAGTALLPLFCFLVGLLVFIPIVLPTKTREAHVAVRIWVRGNVARSPFEEFLLESFALLLFFLLGFEGSRFLLLIGFDRVCPCLFRRLLFGVSVQSVIVRQARPHMDKILFVLLNPC